MKYCVVIMDGAAGLPLPDHERRTCLELARTPNLDRLAREGTVGLVRTVPPGMEPSSACACMSLLGYDPVVYYRGRASIEALSMGIPVGPGEVVFRCNLVAVRDGKMLDYSAGHIASEEAAQIVATLNEKLGSERVRFYPGVSYRHILKLSGMEETLQATCTPPHDIPGQPIAEFLPKGPGSNVLLDLMRRSEAVLRDHPVNARRRSRGEVAPTTIWLFWGSGAIPQVPSFQQAYGLRAAMTSGVDLLRGLAKMMSMTILEIPGVTDGLDNDCAAQANGGAGGFRPARPGRGARRGAGRGRTCRIGRREGARHREDRCRSDRSAARPRRPATAGHAGPPHAHRDADAQPGTGAFRAVGAGLCCQRRPPAHRE